MDDTIGLLSTQEGSLLVRAVHVTEVWNALKSKRFAFPGDAPCAASRGDPVISRVHSVSRFSEPPGEDAFFARYRVIHLSRAGIVAALHGRSAFQSLLQETRGNKRRRGEEAPMAFQVVDLRGFDSMSDEELKRHILQFEGSEDGTSRGVVHYLHDVMATSLRTRSSAVNDTLEHWKRRAAQVDRMNRHPGGEAGHRKAFTYCELFAGIGGFRLGLDPVGGHCVAASEIDAHAANRYLLNHPGEAGILSNINGIGSRDLPPFDLLVGGFPCQSYCRLAVDPQGLMSANGQLIHSVIRVLHHSRPKAFLLENVPNLIHVNAGE
eukprot:GHVH01008203.1.p1 GENE.GHVH01008203.1~~GHVH01008203.1.p1  ORF type:complete len:322 (+),score=58.33 GHVH01008203.1:211-1176(+)